MKCRACDAEAVRVIYLAMPGWLCLGPESHVGGVAGTIASWLPMESGEEGFKFMTYEKGRYFAALWAWLRGSV